MRPGDMALGDMPPPLVGDLDIVLRFCGALSLTRVFRMIRMSPVLDLVLTYFVRGTALARDISDDPSLDIHSQNKMMKGLFFLMAVACTTALPMNVVKDNAAAPVPPGPGPMPSLCSLHNTSDLCNVDDCCNWWESPSPDRSRICGLGPPAPPPHADHAFTLLLHV